MRTSEEFTAAYNETSVPVSFAARLRIAAEEGILMAVKLAIGLAAIILTVSYLLGDYTQTRQSAQQGKAAFDFIQQQIVAQKKAPLAPQTQP